jgi:hypothetical protein
MSLRPSRNWLLTRCQSWTDLPPPLLSFWRTSLITAFSFLHRSISRLTIGRLLWPTGPLSWLDPSDHWRIVLIVLFFLQSADCTLFFIDYSSLSLLTSFSKKMVSTPFPRPSSSDFSFSCRHVRMSECDTSSRRRIQYGPYVKRLYPMGPNLMGPVGSAPIDTSPGRDC